ncbi:MAG: hypothetical protein KF810_17970 [Rhizobiaceae bacterium]|nr:hypothetical protein [Rhizobiaceae bacterium]
MEEPPVGASDWVVQVTPYLWASGIEGAISPFTRAPTVNVDVPFSDIWDSLNFGGFLNIGARRDRFVFSGDIMYVNLSDAGTIGTLPTLPGFPGGAVDASLDTVQFYAAALGGYRVVDTPEFTLDAMAGGRFWYISNDITVSYNGFSLSRGADFTWIDPLVGARALYNFSDKVSVLAQADIGGFGVGSELTWSVLGTFNYVFNDNWSTSVGYKYLSVDYADDGYVFDVDMSGPVVGFTYRFN